MDERRYKTFDEFWPYYLSEHSDPANRVLHATGPLLLPVAVVAAIWTGAWWLLLLVPILGYGAAWLGHLLIEHNRPATLRYPLWSLLGDFRMVGLMCGGRLEAEAARAKDRRIV